ncbi:putative UDP-glucose flavonoid 3-O-glucosyltransferase 3 [Rosa sericea]
MKKAAELVFIPCAGVGHLISTVEIAKLLVSREDHLFITVLVMKAPFDSKGNDACTEYCITQATDRIKFINLPQPDVDFLNMTRINFRKSFFESHRPYVRDAVTKLLAGSSGSSTPGLAGFVIDMFCTTMIDVANEFGVPTYIFFTSNAGFLGLVFHLQMIHDDHDVDIADLKDSDSELVLPSFVNPVPIKALPSILLEKEEAIPFLNYARRFRETKGILINTFSDLEPHALRSLDSYGKIPPVYPVGPLLKGKSDDNNPGGSDQAGREILKWLDDQLPSSVVFLCFGSMGSFGEDQVKEIACALEQSGHLFLWSIRCPPPKGKITHPSDYADPAAILPEGFLERTAGIGKVIGWAPQVAVLAHPAVGGFVSHCGWNSILESLWFGVPVATWPMYSEQQMNAFEMVKELELAVKISVDYGWDFYNTGQEGQMVLSAQEIERGIREVMEHDSNIRKKVNEMSEMCKKALMDGGSSYSSLGRFIDQIFL